MFIGGNGGGDGNQPTLQQILERMRKLEQDLAVERALRQMGNPGGTTVLGQGNSAPPVVPGRAARDASAIKVCMGEGSPALTAGLTSVPGTPSVPGHVLLTGPGTKDTRFFSRFSHPAL